MSELFDLDRFVQAQDQVMEQVRRELLEGRKRSHWMWFVFPQLRGLGHSSMARHYAIASLDEAEAYLRHPILGPRLIECSELVNRVKGRSINEIFGGLDDRKFHSPKAATMRAASSSCSILSIASHAPANGYALTVSPELSAVFNRSGISNGCPLGTRSSADHRNT